MGIAQIRFPLFLTATINVVFLLQFHPNGASSSFLFHDPRSKVTQQHPSSGSSLRHTPHIQRPQRPFPSSHTLSRNGFLHSIPLGSSRIDTNDNTDPQSEQQQPNRGTKRPKEIYVLGGGFGGLNTALTLASLPWSSDRIGGRPRIVLVDRKERFVFLPLLYELCVGDAELEEVAPTFRSLLQDSNVEFLLRDIRGIDAENSTIYLSSDSPSSSSSSSSSIPSIKEEALHYDSLVIATGADIDLSAVPGASQFALPFYTVEDCYELRRTLALLDTAATKTASTNQNTNKNKVRAVVIGGGYGGVELALNIKQRLEQSYETVEVTLVHRGDGVLQYATEHNRQTGIDRLEKAGVDIRTGCTVVDVCAIGDGEDAGTTNPLERRRCTVNLKCKTTSSDTTDAPTTVLESVDTDLLLWTAGASSANVPKGVLNSVLPRDSSGRIVVDEFLRVGRRKLSRDGRGSGWNGGGKRNVFAVGDRARVAPREKPYGATAQVALQQAAVAGWNVYASLMYGGQSSDNNDNEIENKYDEQQLQRELLPFRYLDLGEMLTLGTDDASITSLGGLVKFDGANASVLRRLIYAVRMPTARQAAVAARMGVEKRLEGSRMRGRLAALGRKKKKGVTWK